MFRSGLAILAFLGCAVCGGPARQRIPRHCAHRVPTLCPPTECGLVDSGVVPYSVEPPGPLGGLHHRVNSTAGKLPVVWASATGAVELPIPPHTQEASASGINDIGTIVGIRWNISAGNFLNDWACVWRNGQVIDLPGEQGMNSYAFAVNNYDWVVGTRLTIPPGLSWIGFIWHDGVMVEIDPLPYGRTQSGCASISDTGWVVGVLGSDGYPTGLAYRWRDGAVQTLQPLPGAVCSAAYGVNCAGIAVGRSMFDIPQAPGLMFQPTVWGWTARPPRSRSPRDT
ncbi:MAG: hypothetical protein U0636_00805 [Phycisphaerales bacterium]